MCQVLISVLYMDWLKLQKPHYVKAKTILILLEKIWGTKELVIYQDQRDDKWLSPVWT